VKKWAIASALLVALVLLAGVFWQPLQRLAQPQPNVLVVLVDTLRADHLGSYGYRRDTSPAMDALAARGLLFEHSYSVSNWTNPAIKSLFTGLPPQSVMKPARHREAITLPLPVEVETFAELAKAANYRTHALVDHPGINAPLQFDQGFDTYTMLFREGTERKKGWEKSDTAYVISEFEQMLDRDPDTAFLAYLHVVYPHMPYDRIPDQYRGRFGKDDYSRIDRSRRQMIINAYDAQVRQTDDLVASLVERLDQRGLLENTWIIITSDHGEAFWEHGRFEHGKTFFDEEIKVPLIIVPPLSMADRAQRVTAPVSTIDVFPTIAALLRQPLPPGRPGVSLADGLATLPDAASRPVFSESPHSLNIHARAIVQDGYKLHVQPRKKQTNQEKLFNLAADPGEKRDLLKQERPRAKELRGLLREHQESTSADRKWLQQTVTDPDAETLEGLKSLGYIQ
jgi:arylsulfatase